MSQLTPNIDFLRDTFDSLPGSIFLTDKTSRVVYVNKAVTERTGFSVAEVVGKKPRELWGGQMLPDFYVGMWRRLQADRLPFVSSVVNRKKSGEAYEDPMHVAPIFDETGGVAYYLEVQPKFDNAERLDKFTTEFQSVLSQQLIFGSDIVEWMLPWLGQHFGPMHKVKETIKDLGRATKHLGSFLADVFVLPTQRFFYTREEDRELILAAKKDPATFKKLYIKYKKEIFLYFLHHVKNESVVADDLSQETFYRALRYLPDFQVSNASYRTYLLRVAHSVLVNHYRKEQPILLEDKDLERPDLRREFKDWFDRERVRASLSALSEPEQMIVKMYYENELSVHEISALLNKTENAIKLSLSRARKRLKEMLK